MYLHWLMFALASVGLVSDAENCNQTEYSAAYDKLFVHLGLDKNGDQKRPFYDEDGTHVYMELYVSSIIDVNEKAQSLMTQVRLITAWMNRNMGWNSNEFCEMRTFSGRKDKVWTPDIVIVESIKTEFGTKESPYLQFYDYGYTVLSDILALTSACKMDLHKFPFDIHSCNMTLQSSAYSIEELKVLTFTDPNWVTHESKQSFQAQGEWELVNINIDKSNISVGYEWDMKDQLIYQITIKRRPLLYVINIILPVFFFLVLDVMSFFIDASGADKLSFKVTLLLSISVLLLILNDTLPSTADKIPLIVFTGIYCSVVFSLIGISILETILVNFLMTRGVKKRSAASLETTTADAIGSLQSSPDSVRDQNGEQSCTLDLLKQILSECLAATQQNQQENASLCWTRVARIIDVTFLVLYIITIIVFLSVLGKIWFHSDVLLDDGTQ
ncbi:5-hydroxytryptamine receptor 3A-like isoform X1 [Onychostoma macrolepis]|uniref:5-hydroxytryptamine receptor 3A-like isoform X1 n=1 Tax=Onychostoma macrolepis TaxID=369639 RepID=UPI00272CB050|nr:5-hydroxytryptamine receptor 3A-like isoform X1 [Onychostoma macrolepis]